MDESGRHRLSERSQTQKAIDCMNEFILNMQNKQMHRCKKQISGCQGLEGGENGE